MADEEIENACKIYNKSERFHPVLKTATKVGATSFMEIALGYLGSFFLS